MKSDSSSNAFPHRVLAIAGVLGAFGVGLGAFGAHGLESLLVDWGRSPEVIPKRLAQFDVGVRYHLVHALAILAMSALPLATTKLRGIIVGLFVSGIVFFSGSLYLLVLAEKPILGAVTPIGGVCLIAAWSLLVVLAMKNRNLSR
jgi:uncharacterized membrane protein YgdD (TMEM256/DUF423 family)